MNRGELVQSLVEETGLPKNVVRTVVNALPTVVAEVSAFYIGQLFYFFEKACGISGYMLGVNPFNQPGVEAYKKNMFALLNKPGYEKESEAIKARL